MCRSKSGRSYAKGRTKFRNGGEVLSYRALYRKYRPSGFNDVVGQDHIVTTLKNELKEGKIFHAYLFTGPRGTGKTSCAKILAKAVNCLSLKDGDACLECTACRNIDEGNNLDVVEMDAASNRGIDNIRDLKDQVNYQPANSKYRVYIIDEVHMLSVEAFNALLKTLEEPPAHIVFVLATTEVHKLPATILSRCQRFDFKRIEPKVIADRVKQVANAEKLKIDDDAAMLIAALSDGGMRDALSMLDLCASSGPVITEQDVRRCCAAAGIDYLLEFVSFIKAADTGSCLKLIDKLYKNSVDMQRLSKEMVSHYRNLMIAKTVPDPKGFIPCSTEELQKIIEQSKILSLDEIIFGLKTFSETASTYGSMIGRENVEMAAVKLCSPELCDDIEALSVRLSRLEQTLSGENFITPKTVQIKTPKTVKVEQSAKEETQVTIEKEEVSSVEEKTEKVAKWQSVLDELFKTAPVMASVLTDSSAYVKGDYLLIKSDNTQFLDLMRSNSSVHRDSLRNAAERVLGKVYKIGPYKRPQKTVSNDPLQDVMNKLSELEVPEKI